MQLEQKGNGQKSITETKNMHVFYLVDVEERLQLDDKLPFVVRDLLSVELLERVDTLS